MAGMKSANLNKRKMQTFASAVGVRWNVQNSTVNKIHQSHLTFEIRNNFTFDMIEPYNLFSTLFSGISFQISLLPNIVVGSLLIIFSMNCMRYIEN